MKTDTIIKELTFKAVRSSGAGGQHVNKTSTKVEASLSIENSEGLTETEKERLKLKLKNRISSEGIITISCSDTRSQHRNKTLVIERMVALLQQKLKVAKPRKKTKPSKGAMKRRIKSKKEHALKKKFRKPPTIE